MDDILSHGGKSLTNFLEHMMRVELSLNLHVSRYERSTGRCDYRNGYWNKKLKTSLFKKSISVKVPRGRHAKGRYEVMKRYSAEMVRFDRELIRAYVFGIRQCFLRELSLKSFADIIPRRFVDKGVHDLLQSVQDYRQKKVDKKYRYLFLDAVWIFMKDNEKESMLPLLLALGIDSDFQCKVLQSELVTKETADTWTKFLMNLKSRGLTKENLKIIVYGSIFDLKNVLNSIYFTVPKQRCLNRRLTRILDERNFKQINHRQDVSAEILTVFKMKYHKDIQKKLEEFVAKWKNSEPRVTSIVNEDREYLLNYLALPEDRRHIFKTTRIMKPVIEDIKDTVDVVTCYWNIGPKREDFFDANNTN